MRTKTINISERRKILYKRRRRRKILFRLSFLASMILLFSFILPKLTSYTTATPSDFSKSEAIKDDSFVVCIDAGHGDWDIGTKGKNGHKEKDITLNIALKLGRLLEKNNIKVFYTRTNDVITGTTSANDSLKERIKISEVFDCDLFISLHCNSDGNSEYTTGVETWYNPKDPKSKNLAEAIQDELIALDYTEDRGIKTYANQEDALAVLELNTATSALIELGFLSNIDDENYLASNRGQNECAEYIKNAIITYSNSLKETSNDEININ